MASPTEKDVRTMTTQKAFKQRVRSRMSKTGESYTAARAQLLRKSSAATAASDGVPADRPGAAADQEVGGSEAAPLAAPDRADAPPPSMDATTRAAGSGNGSTPEGSGPGTDAGAPTSDDAALRATGRTYDEWFAILDQWGAAEWGHTTTARWLVADQRVDGWWAQSVTVAYERARGLRAKHQMARGFSVSVNRTVTADSDRVVEALTDASVRDRWLGGARVTQRPTRAALTVRFDWADPPSRVAVFVAPKPERRATVSVMHEKLPDSDAAEHMKAFWRERLGALKSLLEDAGRS